MHRSEEPVLRDSHSEGKRLYASEQANAYVEPLLDCQYAAVYLSKIIKHDSTAQVKQWFKEMIEVSAVRSMTQLPGSTHRFVSKPQLS